MTEVEQSEQSALLDISIIPKSVKSPSRAESATFNLTTTTTTNFYESLDKSNLEEAVPDGNDPDNGSLTTKLTTSLVKSIVGSGVLALPAGIASLGSSISAIVPATALICGVGLVYAYFFNIIGRVCQMTQTANYRDAWEKTVGTKTSALVSIVIVLKTALSCLAYSMILADSFQTLLAETAGMKGVTRNVALVGVTALALLPLCLLKSLKALAPFSLLGLLCIGFTAGVMGIRALDGTYRGPDGIYYNQLSDSMKPSFEITTSNEGDYGIVLACTLATAFVAHYNAPRFFLELTSESHNPERNNQDMDCMEMTSTTRSSIVLDQFLAIIQRAFGISAASFIFIALAGFMTFGGSCKGFILNNYSAFDPLVTASRAALAFSITLTYPLPFVGFRDGVLDLFKVPNRSDKVVKTVSIGLLLAVTLTASVIEDLQLILAVGGATFSTAVATVFPALMFRAAVVKHGDEKSKKESLLALALMFISIALGASGVTISIRKILL